MVDLLAKPVGVGGCVSKTDRDGRQFCVVAAEREDAVRFIVHADQKLTAFLELEGTTEFYQRTL